MNTDCLICLNAISALNWRGTLKCGHRYHRGCILIWLQEHACCPLCRAPVDMTDIHIRKRRFFALKKYEERRQELDKIDEYALDFYNRFDPLPRPRI